MNDALHSKTNDFAVQGFVFVNMDRNPIVQNTDFIYRPGCAEPSGAAVSSFPLLLVAGKRGIMLQCLEPGFGY